MVIGVLTSGGDCPGLNAVLYGLSQVCAHKQIPLTAFVQNSPYVDRPYIETMSLSGIDRTILSRGGTMLGSMVWTDFAGNEPLFQSYTEALKKALAGVDALVVIAGDSGIRIGYKLCQSIQLPMIAIPKTIDNDVVSCDFTLGFQSAIEFTTQALDNLAATAFSHRRIMIAELMGRDVGFIALHAGLAASADVILVPEHGFDRDELLSFVAARYQQRQTVLIVIAEGVEKIQEHDPHYRSGVGEDYARLISDRLKLPVRHTCLGHLQRGCTPSAFDRMMGQRMANRAVELIQDGHYNQMIHYQHNQILHGPIPEHMKKTLAPVEDWIGEVQSLGIFI